MVIWELTAFSIISWIKKYNHHRKAENSFLMDYRKQELIQFCRNNNINGYSNKNKVDIIHLIFEHYEKEIKTNKK